MIANKNMVVLMILALVVLAIAIFVITMSFDIQLTGGFDTILGHCVGSSCSSI